MGGPLRVLLLLLLAAATRSADVERLINGGFETCDLTGWAVEPASLKPDTVLPYAQPSPTNRCAYSAPLGSTSTLVQVASTPTGRTHRLEFDLSNQGQLTSFAVELHPPPMQPARVLKPAYWTGTRGPLLQPGSTAGCFSFGSTAAFSWTRYYINFEPPVNPTNITFRFSGATDFLTLDRASLLSEDIPVIQSILGTKAGAILTVTLANPQPGAVYTVRAFEDEGTQPDGEAVPVSDTSHRGTPADPFVFTWPWPWRKGRPLPDDFFLNQNRWFMVTVDHDGSGPGEPVQSNLAGPLFDGAPNPFCEQWAEELKCTMCTSGWQGADCDRSSALERLVNGGFETNDFRGWSLDNALFAFIMGPSDDMLRPASGSHSLYLVGASVIGSLSQTAATSTGHPHRLSFSLQVLQKIHPSSLFTIQLRPAPAGQARILAPEGDENAPQLQPGSSAGSFNIIPTALVESWTLYEIEFVAAGPSTSLKISYRGKDGRAIDSTAYAIDDVSLVAEDYPMVLSARGARDSASFNVTLFSPQPGAAYYIRAFADAASTQPDGGPVQLSDASHNGTATDPFTFTWPYTAVTPPVQRWFIVEVDGDGDGPGQHLKSTINGPVLVGVPAAPQLTNPKGSNTTKASVTLAPVAGATRYRIEAQQIGTSAWREVSGNAVVGFNTFNLPSKGHWCFRSQASNANGWGDPSDGTLCAIVGLPAAPAGFTVASPFADMLSVTFAVTAEHLQLGTRFYVRGVGSSRVQASPLEQGPFTVNLTAPAGSYAVHVDVENDNFVTGAAPISAGPRTTTVVKLHSPTILNVTGSGSSGPTLRFMRPANSGDATLAWSFTLLGSGNSKAGNASWTIPAASITGIGTAAIPHSAVLTLTNDLLRSGGLFTLQLTATLTAGRLTDSATTPASGEFGLGKPLAPTITSATGGEKAVTVVLSMPQTVTVAGITTQAIRPSKFALGLQPLLAGNSMVEAELNVPAGAGPFRLTHQPATPLPRDEWIVMVVARHANGDSKPAQWPTPVATGLPVAVTLGTVVPGPTNVTIRFTHAPGYSQGVQARVRVWNPVGADGKLLASGKEVEETLPAPNKANAGVIPAGPAALNRLASPPNTYEVVARIGSTADRPIPRPGRWKLSVELKNAVGFGPASTKSGVLEIGLPLRIGAPNITAGQGQVAVRINQTRMEWPAATNPPTVREYIVRLEQIVNNAAKLVTTTIVPAASAGKDVVFGGLAAGRYRALVTPCGVNGCSDDQPSPPSPSALQPCNTPANCDRTQKNACNTCELCKPGFSLSKGQCTVCTGGQRSAACDAYQSPGTSCVCAKCKNGWRLDKGSCVQCPAITNCDNSYSPGCKCTKCKQYFAPAANGQSCTCSLGQTVTAASCAQRSSDQCSCKTCQARFGSNGAGGCRQCPAVANCDSYSPTDCKCTKCRQHFTLAANGQSCTCSLAQTVTANCAQKNTDQCSCKTCKAGFGDNGTGGCRQCPTITNCESYSTADCKCTKCKQYFTLAANGQSCMCSLGQTVTPETCAEKNSDQCSCKTCQDLYGSNGAGGCQQCPVIRNCDDSYSPTDCKCKACKQYFTLAANGRSCTCSLGQTVTTANCAQKNTDQCSCKTCQAGFGSDSAGGCRQCPTITNCESYSTTDCKCTKCKQYLEPDASGQSCRCSAPANCLEAMDDNCRCLTCDNSYSLNTSTKQCEKCANDIPNCFGWADNACTCQECYSGHALTNGDLQCEPCTNACDLYFDNSCDCDDTPFAE